MENLKIGDYVIIHYTDDNDLQYWLDEQEEKGVTQHQVIDIDFVTKEFWIDNCDYVISYNDDYSIVRK